jgi:hypothetical protein
MASTARVPSRRTNCNGRPWDGSPVSWRHTIAVLYGAIVARIPLMASKTRRHRLKPDVDRDARSSLRDLT